MQEEIFIRECGVTISQVVTASYYENIKGEMTLSFQVPTEQVQRVEIGHRLEFGRQYFDIVSMEQSIAEGRFLTTISAEQISLSLADEEHDLESFVFSGTAEDALDAILDDTDFYGYISSNSGMHVEFNRTGTINRRALLQELCGKIQCELQYDREMIELVSPEDSRGMIEVGDYPMIEFNISRTKDGTTYELVTNRFDDLVVGATAYIELREPYNIFERSRVIALSYNPFYRKEIVVTMGDYQPDIIDEMVDDREETENIRDSLKDYVTNDIFDDKVSSSINTYINSEGGKSSLVHSLKGEYVTTDEATGFVTKQNVSAEIAAYVDSKAGTAQITQKLEGTFLKEDALGNYVQKTSLSTEIGSYIDTQAGTAKIISAASGTYQTKDGMSGYVTKTNLNTSIGQYIDNNSAKIVSAVSGTYQKKSDMTGYVTTTNLNTSIGQYIDNNSAKIVSAVSGTYQTKSGMSDYAKVTAVNTIEQAVSEVESSITLSSSYTKNTIGTNVYALLQLVSNANSSSIKLKADKIDFTGFTTFLRASDLGSSGSTTIDGGRITTGTISADRINADSLKVKIIYGTSTYKDTTLIYSAENKINIGGTSITESKAATVNIYSSNATNIYGKNIYLGCSTTSSIEVYMDSYYFSYLRSSTNEKTSLGDSNHRWKELYTLKAQIGGSVYYISLDDKGNIKKPHTLSSGNEYYTIGEKDYPFNTIYVQDATVTKTLTVLGSSIKVGNNSVQTYYLDITNQSIAPSINSTSQTFYLGKSTAYWHYAYIGSSATYIGNSTSSKVGFFGATPVIRQTVSSTGTYTDLIKALKAYGLIG